MAHKYEHVSTGGGFSVLNDGTKTEVIAQDGTIKGDIKEALAQGSVYIGNSSGVTSELDISGDTKILVGNGTTATSVAMSGDTTIDNAGVVTIGGGKVTGAKRVEGKSYSIVATETNGTTTVDVFGATNGFDGTITGVYLISKDTTAGTITIATDVGTVATIAKGATAGAMVGANSIANTGFTSAGTLTVVSDSAGEATVFITFTVA